MDNEIGKRTPEQIAEINKLREEAQLAHAAQMAKRIDELEHKVERMRGENERLRSGFSTLLESWRKQMAIDREQWEKEREGLFQQVIGEVEAILNP